eukprot:14320060-Alexandrium_andersonii.AAC.1
MAFCTGPSRLRCQLGWARQAFWVALIGTDCLAVVSGSKEELLAPIPEKGGDPQPQGQRPLMLPTAL